MGALAPPPPVPFSVAPSSFATVSERTFRAMAIPRPQYTRRTPVRPESMISAENVVVYSEVGVAPPCSDPRPPDR